MTMNDQQYFISVLAGGDLVPGICYVEGQLLKRGAPVLSYRTQFKLLPSDGSGVIMPWMNYE